jgi:transketolase
MTDFGASAPAKDLYEEFSITKDSAVNAVKMLLKK